MSVFVFLGPSLELNRAKSILPDAHYLPPIACGDIISILPLKPTAIIIIDGYFENRPSVWHKEIIYAMSLGVIIYGAASMGALRASELYSFGMIGIGKIYHMYKDSIIIDDDEVVLIHSLEIDGFKPYTIPMINIRLTVEYALKKEIINQSLATEFLKQIKNIFYINRTWEVLKSKFKHLSKFNEVTSWLENNYIDQKMIDAEEALVFVKNNLSLPIYNTKVSNTSLLRNLKIDKLSMTLSFFMREFQLNIRLILLLNYIKKNIELVNYLPKL